MRRLWRPALAGTRRTAPSALSPSANGTSTQRADLFLAGALHAAAMAPPLSSQGIPACGLSSRTPRLQKRTTVKQSDTMCRCSCTTRHSRGGVRLWHAPAKSAWQPGTLQACKWRPAPAPHSPCPCTGAACAPRCCGTPASCERATQRQINLFICCGGGVSCAAIDRVFWQHTCIAAVAAGSGPPHAKCFCCCFCPHVPIAAC